MENSLEELLGVQSTSTPQEGPSFSFLFFSDVRKDISDKEKYQFMRDVTVFGDQAGFEAIYLPERHFYEFGAIYPNSAIMASYLIPQTKHIRFRTAGISLPLHHPAEVVEWWAMNDILSGGRVDLGFGSGWNKPDFILSPDTFENRREICKTRIDEVKRLWRGEAVSYPGPAGKEYPITVYPRPLQKELNVWFLSFQSDESYAYAGSQGLNLFTMLYGNDLDAIAEKIAIYRNAREKAGYDPKTGKVSLMLHTLVHKDMATVEKAVEAPFKEYIRSALKAHMATGEGRFEGKEELSGQSQEKILEYAYQRYFKTSAIFGTVEDGQRIVDKAIEVGVDDIACLVDFGMDYQVVRDSLPYLSELVNKYKPVLQQ